MSIRFSFITLGLMSVVTMTAVAGPQARFDKLPFSPECAAGRPDAEGREPEMMGWIPMPGKPGEEWLSLEYESSVLASCIKMRFSAVPEALIRFVVMGDAGIETEVAWKGIVSDSDPWMYETPCSVSFPIRQVKLYFDTRRGPVAVEAVGLVNAEGKTFWAVDAAASSTKAHGVTDYTRDSADCAEQLLDRGGLEDIALAVQHLEAILHAQETSPQNVRHGNYSRSASKKGITDNNWACFILFYLVPMMNDHADRIPDEVRSRVLESIRIASAEIRRLDVAISYTNIAAMSCLATILAGELLDDASMAEYGYAKTRAFADQFFANGATFEYNAPTYTYVTVAAFSRLAHYTHSEEMRVLARLIVARLVSSYALHIYRPTGRLAGPYARVYYPSLTAISDAESEYLAWWTHRGVIPDWIGFLRNDLTPSFQITETAIREWKLGMTTFLTPEFAMGSGSREISRQTVGFTLHYPTAGCRQTGVVYSQYLMDDTWFGCPGDQVDRSRHLPPEDMGMFHGVQDSARMIGVYAPRVTLYPFSLSPCSLDQKMSSAKAVIVWSQRDSVESVWIDGHKVETYPVPLKAGSIVVAAMRDVFLAIRLLTCSDLGADAPIRLHVVENNLVLEMYNYLGPAGQSLCIDPMSRFYQGLPRCGFYAEAAKRSDYPGAKAFSDTVAAGTLRDDAKAPFTTYMAHAERPWTVEYRRNGKTIGMEIDLLNWEQRRRWNQDGDLGWPAFESPLTQQNSSGRVCVADALLKCDKQPAWLCGNPKEDLWVAGYYGPPKPLELVVPGGRVKLKRMGSGILVWNKGHVSVEALGVEENPNITRH